MRPRRRRPAMLRCACSRLTAGNMASATIGDAPPCPLPTSSLSRAPPVPAPALPRVAVRHWRRARRPRARGALAARPVGADLRPVGVDHLGPRGRPPGPRRPSTGPSWKPLPVLFTTPFSLVRRRAAPAAVAASSRARAAARVRDGLPARRAPRPAPVAGVDRRRARWRSPTSSSATSRRGNSEGLLVALVPAGRSSATSTAAARDAFLLGFARRAAAPRGVAVRRRSTASGCCGASRALRKCARRRRRARCLPLLWFLPEFLGLGRLPARRRPRAPAHPNCAGVRRPPVPRGLRRASARPDRRRSASAAASRRARRSARATARVRASVAGARRPSADGRSVVALMTQAGFAGNLRYVALPAALVCVLAGVGVGWPARARASAASRPRSRRSRSRLVPSSRCVVRQPPQRPAARRRRRASCATRRELYGTVAEAIDARRRRGAAAGLRRRLHRRLPDAGGRLVPALHAIDVGVFAAPPGIVIAPPTTRRMPPVRAAALRELAKTRTLAARSLAPAPDERHGHR